MDIVERLRSNADERFAVWQVVTTMSEAADEIERLREKYEKLLGASVAFQIAIQNAMFVFEKTVDDIHQKDNE